jgi:hypothetical protein
MLRRPHERQPPSACLRSFRPLDRKGAANERSHHHRLLHRHGPRRGARSNGQRGNRQVLNDSAEKRREREAAGLPLSFLWCSSSSQLTSLPTMLNRDRDCFVERERLSLSENRIQCLAPERDT